MLVGQQDLPRHAHCFGNGLVTLMSPRQASTTASQAMANLFQYVGDEDAGPDNRELAVADCRLGDTVLRSR
jgi:hypothetical protein